MNTFKVRGCAMLLVLLTAVSPARADQPSSVYDNNCALCHQKGGVGLKGQFPRLAGRAAVIASTGPGRRYLINVVLFGMAGRVDVDRTPIVGAMPSFAHLPDADLAAVLNYLIGLRGVEPGTVTPGLIAAGEIRDERTTVTRTPGGVRELRETIPGLETKRP